MVEVAMADVEHLAILAGGVSEWNRWRQRHDSPRPDLASADLSGRTLDGIDFSGCSLENVILDDSNLKKADLSKSDLNFARLMRCNLTNAAFCHADLNNVSFNDSTLNGANFRRANLTKANLSRTTVFKTRFDQSIFGCTVIGDVDLSLAEGLEAVVHQSPSFIDVNTLCLSRGRIPFGFLEGTGMPQKFAEHVPSLTCDPITFYSCFISHSTKDLDFAKRLCADLRCNGVRTWFAPDDLHAGDKFRIRIDESIKIFDKLLIVLSAASIESSWVEAEVEAALEKERQTRLTVLFPIRLDDAVFTVESGWSMAIKRTRHIADFYNWKDYDTYQRALRRLLKDLSCSGSRSYGDEHSQNKSEENYGIG
jgi:uncharacterized protein YjbI with pentapeptide repeats